jgi:hypothetical protein
MRRPLAALPPLALAAVSLAAPAGPLRAQETHLLLVVGLPGQDTYTERFHEWSTTIRNAAVDRLNLAERNVIWLADDPAAPAGHIRDRATVATMRAAVTDIANRAGPSDRVLVVLIGHGTAGGAAGARFNLSGPDLSPTDLDLMLDELAPRPVAVVHTASASGDFVPELSTEGRTVITATRSGREATETWFAGFFAEALAGDGSDLDKDGRISLLEAFEFSRREVARYFEEKDLLATEHALLDDDGDGEGTLEPGQATGDGRLASGFFVGGPQLASATRTDRPAETDDPMLARLYREQEALEQRVAAHRLRRAQMDPAEYERVLEELLVELALKSREIREHPEAR